LEDKVVLNECSMRNANTNKLTIRSRVLENLSHSASEKIFYYFIKPKTPSPNSQQPAAGHYADAHESNPIIFLQDPF
jgi:hypothetical protein